MTEPRWKDPYVDWDFDRVCRRCESGNHPMQALVTEPTNRKEDEIRVVKLPCANLTQPFYYRYLEPEPLSFTYAKPITPSEMRSREITLLAVQATAWFEGDKLTRLRLWVLEDDRD